jgi:flagellar motor switch protein FliN/FliY
MSSDASAAANEPSKALQPHSGEDAEAIADDAIDAEFEEGQAHSAGERLAAAAAQEGNSRRAIFAVPVEVVVCVGKALPPIGELINMRRDAIIVLDRRIDDPVEIRIGDRVIARGELQELEDGSGRLGVRMTEIVDGAAGQ